VGQFKISLKSTALNLLIISLFMFSCKKEPCNLSTITTSTVTDSEGHVYPTVIIEDQEWMTENLNTSLFANGDTIEQIKGDSLWTITSNPGFVYFDNDSARQEGLSYGKIYNFNAANDERNVCPVGWHVSTKKEWEQLIECMDGEYKAGIKLKQSGVSEWNAPNDVFATNESKFSALPHGARTEDGSFYNQRFFAYFWGIDNDPTTFSLSYISEGIASFEVDNQFGASVRCVKD